MSHCRCTAIADCSQTELAINTHGIISDVHHSVANTHTVVSDVHHSVVNTNVMVSEMHRNMLKGQEGADDQHQSVSCIGTRFRRQKITVASA